MTICRVIHDKKNPYVVINSKSIWDKNLSLQDVGLLARLLTRPNDWKIYVSELAKSCEVSRETVNKILTRLIKFGYVARVQLRPKNKDGSGGGRFGGYEYWIFETPKTKEEVSNIVYGNGFSESGDAEFGKVDTTIYPSKPCNDLKEKNKQKDEKLANAISLADLLLEKIKKKNQQFSKTVSSLWVKDCLRILSIRSVEEILHVFSWAINNDFWCDKVLSPAKILKHLDAIEMQISKKNGKTGGKSSAECIQDHNNQAKKYDMTISLKHPGAKIWVCRDGVEFVDGSFYKKVLYDISHEEWKSETGFN